MQTEIVKALMGAAGGGDKLYVDDVFSTYLYTGTGSAKTINNGIDLAGEGGLVWLKGRSSGKDSKLSDTLRGVNSQLGSEFNTSASTSTDVITSFNNNGFTMGTNGEISQSGVTHASWSFRKAKGFFDVVTFTQASGTPTNQRISHSLGSAPGMILMKCTSSDRDWFCYHRSLGKDKYIKLNSNVQAANATNGWGTSEPDATEFGFNANEFGLSTGSTYVAYLFAHDDQIYGENDDASVVKCGSYVGTGGAGVGPVINLGWEPQWLLVKMSDSASGGHWYIMDSMRGWGADGSDNGPATLSPNSNGAEEDWGQYGYDLWTLNLTGFTVGPTDKYNVNNTCKYGETYIWVAIRRPDGYVGKPPELGTDVFAMDTGNSSSVLDS